MVRRAWPILVVIGTNVVALNAQTLQPTVSVDSISLERSPCFGFCAAYRVVIDRTGRIVFRSRNPNENKEARDSISPAKFDFLVRRSREVEFDRFTPTIDPHRKDYCAVVATDHPTVVTTLFYTSGPRRLEHYLGCWGPAGRESILPELNALRSFYRDIDSVVGSNRWARPPAVRQ